MRDNEYKSLTIAARILRLNPAFLKQLAETKQVPALPVNGRYRFKPESVRKALDELAANDKPKPRPKVLGAEI